LVKLRITGKNTIVTIPKEFIEKLGWKIADYIKLEVADGRVLLIMLVI